MRRSSFSLQCLVTITLLAPAVLGFAEVDTVVLCEPKIKGGNCAYRMNDGPTLPTNPVGCYTEEPTDAPVTAQKNKSSCAMEGGWDIEYHIVDGVRNGTDLWDYPEKSYDTGEKVHLSWVDTDGNAEYGPEFKCTVTVDYVPCNSCSVCSLNDESFNLLAAENGGGTFSADCTNVDRGRIAECEPGLPLFYPRVSIKDTKECAPKGKCSADSDCCSGECKLKDGMPKKGKCKRVKDNA
jgi:hypothetical protein